MRQEPQESGVAVTVARLEKEVGADHVGWWLGVGWSVESLAALDGLWVC